jgi:dihydrofolate reductase
LGRIAVTVLASVDAVVEDPTGSEETEHGGWALGLEIGEECERYKLEEMLAAEALLLGRVTYEGLAACWDGRSDETGFAAKVNSMPKYIVSSTLEEPGWGETTVLRGDVVEQVRLLKETLPGEILVPGSLQLVQTLFEEDLLDELRVLLFGRVVGGGRRLFPPGTTPRPMRVARSRNFDNGIASIVFEPRDEVRSV